MNTMLIFIVKYMSDLHLLCIIMLAHRLRQDNFAPVMAALLLVKIWQPTRAMPPTRPQKGSWGDYAHCVQAADGSTTSGWIAACIYSGGASSMGVGRAHVIGKLERRGSQPPAFLGHLVAWYHPVEYAVWFSYRVQAPRLVLIIRRISGIGTGVLYIARHRARACSRPLSLIWHLCKVY